WFEHPALGDTEIDALYSGYREFSGLQFPTHIVQTQGGFPIVDLTIDEVTPNPPVDIQAPARGGGAGGFAVPGGGQAISVRSIKAAEGIFYIIGGTNNSIAVELHDSIVIIEAPQTEERSF